MADQLERDPWQIIWRIATSDGTLVVLMLSLSLCMILRAWLPQIPSMDPGVYARWFSIAQARFGGATAVMQTLGLFAIERSLGFRVLLGLLAGSLTLRVVDAIDQLLDEREMSEPPDGWQTLEGQSLPDVVHALRQRRYRVLSEFSLFQVDRWPWAGLLPVLAHAGALVLLLGLLLGQLWGWQVEGLLLQSSERTTLHGADGWVALSEDGRGVRHSTGLVTYVQGRGTGVEVSAVGDAGQSLALRQAAEADPSTRLNLALAEDQYFAIPEKQLIVRLLTPKSGESSSPRAMSRTQRPVQVQFYRSPSGQLVTEMTTEEGGGGRLVLEDVTLELAPAPYVRLTATFNPGRWPMAVGLLVLAVGLLGSIIWPARRFWLRERDEVVEGTGDLPPPH